MFCSACGAKVRDADSYCWKCGAKVGAPDEAGSEDAIPAEADASQADGSLLKSAIGASTEGRHQVLFVHEDGTIQEKGPKYAFGDDDISTPKVQQACIDPSVYTGTWFDVHQAVLATGFTFEGLDLYGETPKLIYRVNPALFPFVPYGTSEDCLAVDIAGINVSSVRTLDDIPYQLKVGSLQLFLPNVDTHVDTSTLVKMVQVAAHHVGFAPRTIYEGVVGNHNLTDALASAFGLAGKTTIVGEAWGSSAVQYYDKRKDTCQGYGLKARLLDYVGHPYAVYKASLDVGYGINLVTCA
ncbi:zinc ribbon domain-containing protein [Collinsella sp. An268]|uniref:zinc ribbon domain-containing protein n=1 Tax=Collinsella sp. An268 TaxID=1965612 RepID=UPI000B39F804|nr:zinc ribbon domain-containing protein [Collinsella sp. An268]OUO64193.1 hypothetical protein B5F70_06265 [Collinsella sp. An268]